MSRWASRDLVGRAAMLSKVGDEAFGRVLVATLANNGVSTEGVLTTHEGNTSLEVVTVDAEEADVLKVSEEELTITTAAADIEEGLACLWRPRRRLIAVTLGARGALLATVERRARSPGFAVTVVDTVGCGDAFATSLLADLAASQADLEPPSGLELLARRACAAGALAATAAGAMEGLPTAARHDAFLAAADRGTRGVEGPT